MDKLQCFVLNLQKSSSCLSVVPEDITTFTAALAFMIEHVKEIFLIPDDLLQEIENQKSNNLAQVIRPATPTRKVMIELESLESSTMGKIVFICYE
jgi:hypothetical protein